ncbi:hypothetical protein PInf_023713 [Phytophthora infestans]|nr:hypothetical protein PInf_023713 [Phytophthora infestans]
MPPVRQLRASRFEPTTFTLAALAPLLELLDAREVATLVCTQKAVGREGCAAVWFWLTSRTRALLPNVKISTASSHSDTLQFAVVLPLLRQLQAVASYDFDLHFTLEDMAETSCDHMPAVMYCEGGFITTGSFRGPKPQLPARVNFLDADTFKEEDRVGVVVDLLAGFLLFMRNGAPQGMRIPIDRSNKCPSSVA